MSFVDKYTQGAKTVVVAAGIALGTESCGLTTDNGTSPGDIADNPIAQAADNLADKVTIISVRNNGLPPEGTNAISSVTVEGPVANLALANQDPVRTIRYTHFGNEEELSARHYMTIVPIDAEGHPDPTKTVIINSNLLKDGDDLDVKGSLILDGNVSSSFMNIHAAGNVTTFGDLSGHTSEIIAVPDGAQNVIIGAQLGNSAGAFQGTEEPGKFTPGHYGHCYDGDERDTQTPAEPEYCEGIDPSGAHTIPASMKPKGGGHSR